MPSVARGQGAHQAVKVSVGRIPWAAFNSPITQYMIDNKLFEKRAAEFGYDVTVDWRDYPTAPSMVEAIIGNNLDMGMWGNTPIIRAISAKLPVSLMVVGEGHLRFVVATRKGSLIRTIQDLKGKTVGASAYAPKSLTGFVAAGAQIILFTTGVGNAYVSALSPTIKLSANPVTAASAHEQLDFDASAAFLGRESLERTGEALHRAGDARRGRRRDPERRLHGRHPAATGPDVVQRVQGRGEPAVEIARRRAGAMEHPGQLDLPGHGCDRPARSLHGGSGHAGEPREIHQHHPAGPFVAPGGHRQCGALPCLRRGGLHHRGRVPGRWWPHDLNMTRIGGQRDILGESPLWDEQAQALFWVDIRRPALRRLDHASGKVETRPMPRLVGLLALAGSGRLLVALGEQVALYHWAQDRLETVASLPEPMPGHRFNDGRCDRQGRFWVGTMHNVTRAPEGVLYRLDPGGTLTAVLRGVCIPNSLAWSPNGRTMYSADSLHHAISTYGYDPATGAVGPAQPFARTAQPGFPDGSTVDGDGFLWNAEFNGGRLVRYAPDGRADRIVPVPVLRPTSCAFGGPGLDTLFVTTTSQGMSSAELDAQPLAGALLALEVGVRGLIEPRWAGVRPLAKAVR